jgi:hypothetical protein
MLKLYSVDTGYKQSANLQRILTSIIVIADSSDQALQFAQRHYPEALIAGTEHRVIEINHVIVNWPEGETAVIENLHCKQFDC